MLDRDKLIEVLVKLNLRFVETGYTAYGEAYNSLVYSIPKDKRGLLPMRMPPFLISKKDVIEMMEAKTAFDFQDNIVQRSKMRAAEQEAIREALKKVRNMSWWRRLWKQF